MPNNSTTQEYSVKYYEDLIDEQLEKCLFLSDNSSGNDNARIEPNLDPHKRPYKFSFNRKDFDTKKVFIQKMINSEDKQPEKNLLRLAAMRDILTGLNLKELTYSDKMYPVLQSPFFYGVDMTNPNWYINHLKFLVERYIKKQIIMGDFEPDGKLANLCKAWISKFGDDPTWDFSKEFKVKLLAQPKAYATGGYEDLISKLTDALKIIKEQENRLKVKYNDCCLAVHACTDLRESLATKLIDSNNIQYLKDVYLYDFDLFINKAKEELNRHRGSGIEKFIGQIIDSIKSLFEILFASKEYLNKRTVFFGSIATLHRRPTQSGEILYQFKNQVDAIFEELNQSEEVQHSSIAKASN